MPEFRINLLSQETASKIAAGEVVEKPASVVKELVENSIDAGARNITVEVVNGGLDLIRILDDGHGIRNADMERAFLPHATSKIKEINDIFDIMTLGFRGEALASVAAVSRTLLKSHAKEEQDGMEVFYEGGEEKFRKYSALDQGTIIDVRDLFYNVPARLKFLRTAQKETANVTDILTRLALSQPQIAFTFYNNEKLVFRTYGTGKLLDVIRSVYNRKTAEQVTWFEREADGIKIHGYIGNEEIARGSRNQQTIFINGRYITSRSLTAAVEQAFKSFITINKFPFFVLFLELAPHTVDVNVHPQKAEVKFSDERLMFHTVFETIHGTLRSMYQGNLGFEQGLASDPVRETTPETAGQPIQSADFMPFDKTSRDSLIREEASPRPDSSSYFQEPAHVQETWPRPEGEPAEVRLPVDLKSDTARHRLDNPISQSPQPTGSAPEIQLSKAAEEVLPKFPMPRIMGQFSKTYILAELGDALYLIDQHAAHEKINFERYMEDLLQGDLPIQPLLLPQVLDLAVDDYAVWLENEAVFQAAGFAIEAFGERTLNVREVPLFLSGSNAESYFKSILDNLKNLGKGTSQEIRYLRIATAACKASVKANDELTLPEMQHLLEDLRYLKEPFTCPHGRPTMIRFTRTEIEKMFRRIQ